MAVIVAPIIIPVSLLALNIGTGIAVVGIGIAVLAGIYYLGRQYSVAKTKEQAEIEAQNLRATQLAIIKEDEGVEKNEIKDNTLLDDKIEATIKQIQLQQTHLKISSENLDERQTRDQLEVQKQLDDFKEELNKIKEALLKKGMFSPNVEPPQQAANDPQTEAIPRRRGRPT